MSGDLLPDAKQQLQDAMDLDPELAQDLLDYRTMRDRALRGDTEEDGYVPATVYDGWTYEGKRLTARQQAFVLQYLSEPGAPAYKQAEKAGYSPNTAKRVAYELLRTPAVLAALRHGAKYLGMRYSVTQSAVMGEIAANLFADLGDFVDWGPGGQITLKAREDIPSYKRKALKSITQTVGPNGTTTKVELNDKAPFAQLAARVLQMDQRATVEDVADAAQLLAAARRRTIEAVKRETNEKPVETEYGVDDD